MPGSGTNASSTLVTRPIEVKGGSQNEQRDPSANTSRWKSNAPGTGSVVLPSMVVSASPSVMSKDSRIGSRKTSRRSTIAPNA